jgi:hypothetical protein
MIIKSTLNLIIASAKETDNPGSFQETFSKLQTLNSLPVVNLGDIVVGGINLIPFVSNKSVGDIVNEPLNNQPVFVDSAVPSTSRNVQTSGGMQASGDVQASGQAHASGKMQVAGDVQASGGMRTSGVMSGGKHSSDDTLATIHIIKKKSAPRVTTANLKSLFLEGHVYFETSSGLNQEQCHAFLVENSILCDIALTKVKVKDFRGLKSKVTCENTNPIVKSLPISC